MMKPWKTLEASVWVSAKCSIAPRQTVQPKALHVFQWDATATYYLADFNQNALIFNVMAFPVAL